MFAPPASKIPSVVDVRPASPAPPASPEPLAPPDPPAPLLCPSAAPAPPSSTAAMPRVQMIRAPRPERGGSTVDRSGARGLRARRLRAHRLCLRLHPARLGAEPPDEEPAVDLRAMKIPEGKNGSMKKIPRHVAVGPSVGSQQGSVGRLAQRVGCSYLPTSVGLIRVGQVVDLDPLVVPGAVAVAPVHVDVVDAVAGLSAQISLIWNGRSGFAMFQIRTWPSRFSSHVVR